MRQHSSLLSFSQMGQTIPVDSQEQSGFVKITVRGAYYIAHLNCR